MFFSYCFVYKASPGPGFIATSVAVGSFKNRILRNTVSKYSLAGVDLYYASENIIYGNTIAFNGAAGINLYEHADNNTIAGNTIAANGYGIYIYNASGNSIYLNNLRRKTLNTPCSFSWGERVEKDY